MKSLSSKTYQCGVTIQGLTTLSGTVYLTGITNTASWDHVIVGTTAQGQIYTRTYAQFMGDVATGISLSGYVPTSRTLTINGTGYDLSADRSWTITTPFVSKLQHSVKAGVAINKGQAVYVTGADGTNMIVGLASNATEATSSKTMGLLDATVSTNGFANVVTEGLLAGLDTTGATAAGDPVWLGTGGNLIYGLASKPYAPAHLVFIGIVTRRNVSNGEIFVKVQNGFELKEIHDVDLITTAPINGHLLGFDGTLWVNKTIAGWLGYTPANASGTTNYISKFTGSTTLGNSQIFDNGTNVGIGTSSPAAKLTVAGATYLNLTSDYFGSPTTVQLSSGGGSNAVGIQSNTLYLYPYSSGTATSLVYGYNGGATWSLNNAGGSSRFDFYSYGAGANIMSLTSSGNVGIGTTTPVTKLEVNGTVTISGPSAVKWKYSDNYAYFGIGYISGADYGFYNYNYGRADLYIQQSTGNIGIGTTSPNRTLSVNGIVGVSSGTANTQQLVFSVDSGASYITSSYFGSSSYVPIYLEAGGNVRLAILTNGNVGIGTASPSTKLHVSAGNFLISGTAIGSGADANSGLRIVAPISTTHYNWMLGAQQNINSAFEITPSTTVGGTTFSTPTAVFLQNGNVGIGTTSPSTLLDVSGVITATGGNSTNWNTAYGWGNHASASYVPQARTLTINGTSYALSANRTWTIPTSANIQEAANNGKVTTAASVGTTVITTVATATYDGATFNYVLKDGTNYRAGTIIAVWSAGAVQFNETTTNDIGSTVGVTFAVALNAGNAELRATSATPGWTVKVVTIGI